VQRNLERASVVVDSVAAILHNTYSSRQWIYAWSSGRKLHSERNANIDFTAMKYRAANAMLFLLSVQSSFCPLSSYVSLENFLSATLIVFVDHVRGVKLFFENISHRHSIKFYGSALVVNSYVYELIRGVLITITYLRVTDSNKF